MSKKKVLSFLLSLAFLGSVVQPALPVAAEETPSSDNGMKISKTATANDDGTYTITLEAYATGEKIITEGTKDVPTDIVLVLDQSGSMAYDIGTVSFEQYKDESDRWGNTTTYRTRNQDYYKYRHNGGSGNLWHKLADGSYVSVSVKKSTEYTDLSASLVNYATSWGSISANCYFYYANNLYEKVGDEYKKVELSENESGNWYNPTYTYTYTFSDGTSISSTGRDSKPNLGSHAPLYTPAADGDSTVYTYTYTDSNGAVHTIDTSTGANTVFTPAFYQRSTTTSGGGSRLDALKSAATSFANQVATKANGTDGIAGTGDDVKHRIAVVGYAGSSSNLTNGFKQMNNTSQAADVSSAINNLTANGGTHIDQGLSTANGIFASNPIGDTENRNRVVIVFTDGAPGSYGDWCSESVETANNAIAYAKTAKKPTSEGGYGATVYTIGIFSGADASNPDSLPAYTSYTTGLLFEQSPSEADQVKNSNRFMHLVSSNYPAASSITEPGSINPNLNGKSYYLSAGDSASLNNIFQQIAGQIESGGSSTTLDEKAVIKDIIAPQFQLPARATSANITLETYKYTGENQWEKNTDAMGATATVNGDQVNVTGFDFSENWCGTETTNDHTTYRGNKLVISFKVQPKAGFLGGNDVYTNTDAGIYENSSAENPLLTFDRPTVNVPIKAVNVIAADKNVYLKGEVTADQLKNGAKVSVGDVKLDLSKANDATKPYGLDPWQTQYVNIAVTVKDEDGKVISDKLENLTKDTTYTVEVTVAPKTEGKSTPEKGEAATLKTGANDPAKINVFKPELTFMDSEVYYGESVPTNNDYSGNKDGSETWKHGNTASTGAGVTMLGEKPTLDISYRPDESKLEDGKYTKQDVPVAVDVKILDIPVNDYITFAHQACDPACDWNETELDGNPAFLLHVNTCTLNITKQGGAADESYVFDVFKDGKKYSEVTVWGNGTETLVELPIGTYTISEDEGWSWRYNASYGDAASLTAQNSTGTVTCTNSKTKNFWLNGFSVVVKNIFGVSHNN